MVFADENEAYNTYNANAICKGFGVRKGKKANNGKGVLRICTFICNCEGHSPPIPPHEQRDVYRIVKRIGCQACIKFKIEDGVWEVTKFEDVHNHPFIDDKQKHLIQSYRHIMDTSKAGGSNNIGFILRDCQNFLQSKRRNLICAGDCQGLINHFNYLQSNGSNFSYTFQLDEE
ncbi:hypothetical protein BT93_L1081 [Corymbia citriodora subsp. variegata]|uniref:FAR1 domain-containing protein n=1 Tax=Corymbia citriodora subsp. variegata TaxID=360336 RepID=A0A8T0CNF7_CORYI|nr:hypothetical protein BT93_L1081 [Corymbia citriodora subsp. variegata]